jgi:outer membrane lipoprotein SlyB
MTSYGVVQAIDQMQRQDVGLGAVGAAAAGGSTAMPTDRVYRVTVRMDDGTTQLIVVDSMPSYKIGDRVRYNNGTLSSY